MTRISNVLVIKGTGTDLTKTIAAALAREEVTVDSADTIAAGIKRLHTVPYRVVFLVDSAAVGDVGEGVASLVAAGRECRLVYVCPPHRTGAIGAAVAAGALAHLPLPLDPFEIIQTYRRVLALTPKPSAPVPETGSEDSDDRLCKVIGVVGASDNEGKTMVAVNLAAALALLGHHPVCIVDLDLQFGDVHWYLKEQPLYTIADLGGQKVERKHLTACAKGFDLLAAPKEPRQGKTVSAESVQALFQELRHHYRYIVFDTAAGFADANAAAIDEADELVVVATIDNIGAVKNLKVHLETLKKLSVPDERITVVLNRDGAGLSLDRAKVEQTLGRCFDLSLPNDYQTVSAATGAQGVIVGKDSTAKLAKALVTLAARFCPPSAAKEPPESLWDRLRKLFSRP